MDLRKRLRAEHFDELEEIKKGQPFQDVPLWLWSPIISRTDCDRIARAAEDLGAKLLEIGMRERRAGREACWLPRRAGLLESIRSDPWDTDPTFHWRFDFLWDRSSGAFSFIEVNAGDPSGLGWVEGFTTAMRSHSLWTDDLASGRLRAFELGGSHQSALERELGAGPHTVAFAAAEASTVTSDIECWAQYYRRAGYQAMVADPRRFKPRKDGVWLEEARVEAIVRDTYEELFLAPYEGIGERLQRQVLAGKVRLLNPLCASFWDSKTLWTELGEGSTVPLTVRPCDLPVEERHLWVLKPAFDYGGRGVLCGFDCSDGEWQRQIQRAVSQPDEWVLQRAAPTSKELVPIWGPDREIRWEERFLTWSVYLNHLRFAGIIGRAGAGPVVNVHNGGAIFPVYVEQR